MTTNESIPLAQRSIRKASSFNDPPCILLRANETLTVEQVRRIRDGDLVLRMDSNKGDIGD